MSVGHNHRRKTIRQFKKKFKGKWQVEFSALCASIKKARQGPCLGTLAELISPQGDLTLAVAAAGDTQQST